MSGEFPGVEFKTLGRQVVAPLQLPIQVACDRQQIRLHGLHANTVPRHPRPGERLGRQLFCLDRITGQPEREAVDLIGIALVQRVELASPHAPEYTPGAARRYTNFPPRVLSFARL